MIGGIYANSNIEDQKSAIQDIEESFQDIIDTLYDPQGKTRDDYVKEDMEKNPFFTGMQVPVPPENIDFSDPEKDLELLEALKSIDQG
jgi:hypothetical protein